MQQYEYTGLHVFAPLNPTTARRTAQSKLFDMENYSSLLLKQR